MIPRAIALLTWASCASSATNQSLKPVACPDVQVWTDSIEGAFEEFSTPKADVVHFLQQGAVTVKRGLRSDAKHDSQARAGKSRGKYTDPKRKMHSGAGPTLVELYAVGDAKFDELQSMRKHTRKMMTMSEGVSPPSDKIEGTGPWFERIEFHKNLTVFGPVVVVVFCVLGCALFWDTADIPGGTAESLLTSHQESGLPRREVPPDPICRTLISPEVQSYWVPTHALSHTPPKHAFDIAASSAAQPLHVTITEVPCGRMVEVSAQVADKSEHVRVRPSIRSLPRAKSSGSNAFGSLQVLGPGDEVCGELEQRAEGVCLVKNDEVVLFIGSSKCEKEVFNANVGLNVGTSPFNHFKSELVMTSGAGQKLCSLSRRGEEEQVSNNADAQLELQVLPKMDPALALACVLAGCCWHEGDHASLTSDLETVHKHARVLEVMAAYGAQQPQESSPMPLRVIDMGVPYQATWRCLPILLNIFVITWPLVLLLRGWVITPLNFLTLILMWQGYKVGLHSTLFGYAGAMKMQVYEGADFRALHFAEVRLQECAVGASPLSTSSRSVDMAWEDVLHFVILPNYKEEKVILRRTLQTIAASEIASKQIGVVLAMEAREEGGMEKAEALRLEFAGQFRYLFVTEHPPNLPGEMPGKSSNTQWAASQLFNDVFPKYSVDFARAVLTVADADSDFHPSYFSALTYNFLHAGGDEGETPWRYLSLWQPPIMHLKNYLTQPIILRLASIIASTHELANLADPFSSRVLYSTYSISAKLAMAVNGWDPEWISEDWHMTLKCHLATAGRVQLQPIFLAILNYAPEGDTLWQTLCARWAQAKRHALGYAEIVFFLDHFPRVFSEVRGCSARLSFCWRSLSVWFQMTMIHVIGSNFVLISVINSCLIALMCRKQQFAHTLGMETLELLVNIFFQSLTLVSFVCLCWVTVVLFMHFRPRITGAEDSTLSVVWRSRALHFLCFGVPAFCLFPPFVVVAAAAEWIAAWQTAKTHRFDYEVARKPKLSDDEASDA